MFARYNLRDRGAKGLAPAALALATLLACATASTTAGTAEPGTGSLSSVGVESQADATIVSLQGVRQPALSSFQQTDPARVVVDLQGVDPGSVSRSLPVYDGTVEEVTVSEFETAAGELTTRLEIGLGTVASYEVVNVADGVEVRVTRDDAAPLGEEDTLAGTTLAEEDPWAAPAMDETPGFAASSHEVAADDAAEEPAALPVAAAPMAAAPPVGNPATALLGVEARGEGGGAVVELRADGAISEHEHFVLDGPPRLVVDLPGLVSRMGNTQVDVGAAGISKVRVGQHDGKVRIVVDGSDVAALRETELRTTSQGLALALGGAALPAGEMATVPTAPSRKPAAASAPGSVRVYGVQFDAQDARDRVVVLTDTKAQYALFEPDADTLIVRVFGAHIDEDADVRIVPEGQGAISLVTAFDQPEAGRPEVRVVINRASGLDPQVSQEGAMLFLDFPKTGVTAAVPPALEGLGTRGAASKAMAQTSAAATGAVPAALDPDAAALDILQEGGLIDGKQYTGRRISLDFKDVDIDDVLRLIAEVSELNIIAGDEVTGHVTIRLVDVPWDQALDVILLTKGLGFVRVGNVLRIAPAQLLKAEEEARLQERRAKEKLEDLVVKLQPVNYASVKDVDKMVKRLLTPRGSVDIDERTNTIILKDIASVIDEATALVKAIDTQTPQVVIEAKIVEANLDYSREIGTVWGFGVQPFNDAFDTSSGLRQNETVGNDVRLRNNQSVPIFGLLPANNVAVANPITSVATGVMNLGAFLLDDRFNVDLQLEAAESHGEGKVISSPRVVTLDNRKASIEQGVSIPFQTFENGDAKLEFIDAVLRLEVTPHITADRSIIMKIQVQRNAPDDSVQTPTGSPAIAKNEAQTETLVKDGQTLVIGGIYVVRKADRQSRVPYLHNIPVLGNAFKNNEVRDIRQELLVFVTPRIVVSPELGT